MHVAIDTNGLYTTQAGVARYIRGLLRALYQIGPSDLTFFEFAWPVENVEYRQPQRALKTLYRELFWMKLAGPRLLTSRKVDLLHSTVGYPVKPPDGVRVAATLHDLAVFRHPERFRFWQVRSGRAWLSAITKADRIICISRFTAD